MQYISKTGEWVEMVIFAEASEWPFDWPKGWKGRQLAPGVAILPLTGQRPRYVPVGEAQEMIYSKVG